MKIFSYQRTLMQVINMQKLSNMEKKMLSSGTCPLYISLENENDDTIENEGQPTIRVEHPNPGDTQLTDVCGGSIESSIIKVFDAPPLHTQLPPSEMGYNFESDSQTLDKELEQCQTKMQVPSKKKKKKEKQKVL